MKRILAIAFLASCAQSADELEPFPCALDKSCPAGLACVGDVCTAAQLDSLCTSGDDPTNCAAAAPDAVCAVRDSDRGKLGAACVAPADCQSGICQMRPDGDDMRCTQPCVAGQAGSCPVGFSCDDATAACFGDEAPIAIGACEVPCAPGCPAGRACSGTGTGAMCLVDCTDGTACPANTVCKSRNFDSRKVCVPPGVVVAECQSVVAPQICNLCGSTQLNTESCPNGTSTCPHQSTCSADSNFCMCQPGTHAVDCSGQPCNGQCSSNNWWCEPDVSTTTCNSDRFELSGTCHCFDGRDLAFSCMSARTCEDACQL